MAGAAPVRRLGVLSVAGGGAALRGMLREPAEGQAQVVERDPEVLRRGREETGPLNAPYPRDWRPEDALICKFGVPGGGEPWKVTQGNN